MSASRSEILAQANQLITEDRAALYGPPEQSFGRIGKLWAITLGVPEITPAQVALLMAQMKVSRILSSPTHQDSYVDACGYLALAAELALAESTTVTADQFVSVDTDASPTADELRRFAVPYAAGGYTGDTGTPTGIVHTASPYPTIIADAVPGNVRFAPEVLAALAGETPEPQVASAARKTSTETKGK